MSCCRLICQRKPFLPFQLVCDFDDGGKTDSSWVSGFLRGFWTARSWNSIPASARERTYNLCLLMLSTSQSTGWLKIYSLFHSWSQWNSPLCAAVAFQTVSLCQLGGHSATLVWAFLYWLCLGFSFYTLVNKKLPTINVVVWFTTFFFHVLWNVSLQITSAWYARYSVLMSEVLSHLFTSLPPFPFWEKNISGCDWEDRGKYEADPDNFEDTRHLPK